MRPVVFCHDHPDGPGFDPNSAETGTRDIALLASPPPGSFAAIGWRLAGRQAAALAAVEASRVDRLVLCCVPAAIDDVLDFDPGAITAKTLLLFGQHDPDAPSRHARWWKDRIPDARVEMVPRSGNEIIGTMWKRILSHAAPNASR